VHTLPVAVAVVVLLHQAVAVVPVVEQVEKGHILLLAELAVHQDKQVPPAPR
jgi:hypothetical protein